MPVIVKHSRSVRVLVLEESWDFYAGRRYAGGLGPSRVRTRIPTTRRLCQWVSLRKILRFRVRYCKFPILVASLFSWRCLAASSSSSLHAAMNLRPPSVTASTQTSAFNAIVFQFPVMPNARMSLCTQSVHSFSFPPRPLRTAPSRFQHACLVFVVDHTRCVYGI